MEIVTDANTRWIAAMAAKGHTPIMDGDRVDLFVMDDGEIHNGPGCYTCRDSWCMHCTSPNDIPQCTG